jgi:sigma-B regulation protein RsbU (phosphoserine phosphatase)
MIEIPKILIVDDEKDTRDALNDYLSNRIECQIIEAENGYEALKQLQNDSIDLILLDINMPGISGAEVIKEAKAKAQDISIIVITKWDSFEVASKVKELGADYIPKPLSLKVLRLKVEEKLKTINKLTPKGHD